MCQCATGPGSCHSEPNIPPKEAENVQKGGERSGRGSRVGGQEAKVSRRALYADAHLDARARTGTSHTLQQGDEDGLRLRRTRTGSRRCQKCRPRSMNRALDIHVTQMAGEKWYLLHPSKIANCRQPAHTMQMAMYVATWNLTKPYSIPFFLCKLADN